MLFSFMKEVMVMGLDPVTGVQPKLAKVFKFNENALNFKIYRRVKTFRRELLS